ncbi:esterase-like activity of phytase family protein [Salinibius halmophilus]|uniref:esterase-like activity of phytase family protein n=1 Tax=Salinibius halmophilus TaxID=1853216 RepID=UPI000E673199|nr:esterase-like activity of phytase family protein [Salinibius halmophilus]
MFKRLVMMAAVAASTASLAQQFPATLVHHAQLPAATLIAPPNDAPDYFQHSGRFTAGERVEALYNIVDSNTGIARPFLGQPVQGFSGIRSLGSDRFLVLTDNGFGSKANSPDAMLMFHEVRANWEGGTIERLNTTFIRDPNKLVPFPIISETSATRYLTGADFDLESIQPVAGGYVIGDEFGPWLIHINKEGVVQAVVATEVNGQLYRSPDNAFERIANPGQMQAELSAMRSGGYEGMAVSQDGRMLYPLLEKPIFDAASNSSETINGQPVLRMFEYDTVNKRFHDKVRFYPLAVASHAIGDFNMIDEHRALIIERDSGQGDAREGWSNNPARFKRIYLVDLRDTDENGVLRKIAFIDLLAIQDPNNVAPRGSNNGLYTFPFVTIENVDRIDENHIVVANDNNFPFSVGRQQGRVDDNEFIVLEVGDFLKAE